MSTRRFRIAFLVGKFPAISETFILNQITGLIDAGHHVDIFAQVSPCESKVQTEIQTYGLLDRTQYIKGPDSLSMRYRKGLRLLLKTLKDGRPEVLQSLSLRAYGLRAFSLNRLFLLYPLMECGPYDILHCHFGPQGLAGVQLKEMGVPGKLIVAFHGQDISGFLNASGNDVYQELFQKADLLMPISDHWKRRLIELGADPSRVQIHRMGIDLANFPFHPRSYHKEGTLHLLTVSRLVEKKGLPFAVEAVAKVLQRNPALRIQYSIIGGGELAEDLHQMIARMGLDGCVKLLGEKTSEEIHQYMRNSHIFLLPSVTDMKGNQEGIPVVLMEAMATGMPIVSTQHTGIPELVEDGASGYLAPERDVDALAVHLEWLINHPEEWLEMGRIGRRSVEDHHDIHALNRKLAEVYEQLVNGETVR